MEPVSAAFSTPALSPSTPNLAIERKAQEFEALVLSQLLQPMFETVKSASLFGGEGPEQDAFQSLLNDEYARAMAARGGIGIADQVQDALLRLQSAKNS